MAWCWRGVVRGASEKGWETSWGGSFRGGVKVLGGSGREEGKGRGLVTCETAKRPTDLPVWAMKL